MKSDMPVAQEKVESEKDSPTPPGLAFKQKVLGVVFGVIFGFLLQKGGVAKYDLLVGSLLLQDMTVFKVILSAIAVGSAGVFALHHAGLVDLQFKPTKYAANIIGGLIFGVGFGLSGYCPGTGAAALGQGNYDAAFMVLGMLAGSYVYALMSGWLSRTVQTWGDRGRLLLPEIVHLRRAIFLPLFIALIGVALAILEVIR